MLKFKQKIYNLLNFNHEMARSVGYMSSKNRFPCLRYEMTYILPYFANPYLLNLHFFAYPYLWIYCFSKNTRWFDLGQLLGWPILTISHLSNTNWSNTDWASYKNRVEFRSKINSIISMMRHKFVKKYELGIVHRSRLQYCYIFWVWISFKWAWSEKCIGLYHSSLPSCIWNFKPISYVVQELRVATQIPYFGPGLALNEYGLRKKSISHYNSSLPTCIWNSKLIT